MATEETKTLRLKIVSESLSAEQALDKFSRLADHTGTSVTGLTTSMKLSKNGVEEWTHSLTLASREIEKLIKAKEMLAASKGEVSGGKIATSNVLKEVEDEGKAREAALKSAQSLRERLLKEEVALTAQLQAAKVSVARDFDNRALTQARQFITEKTAIIKNGENSIAAIEASAATKRQQLEEQLQDKLKSLRQRFAEGEINLGNYKGAANAIIASYRNQVVTLNQATDERIKKLKELEAAEARKPVRRQEFADYSAKEMLAQTRAAIQEEIAINQYGANSKEAIRARSIEKQRQLEFKLQEDIRKINEDFAKGKITIPERNTQLVSTLAAYRQEMVKLVPTVQEVNREHTTLFKTLGGFLLATTALHRFKTILESTVGGIAKVGIELDAVKASLTATMGSTAGMHSALAALDKEAERTGINILTLRENFANFQASTSLSGASLEQTWKMFTDLNTTITALHLSTDKAKGVFNAITQIFNKSKVQSEELVKQLGNLLPAAFASFATSMGISTEELSKRMKAGTVIAQDTMKNFLNYYANTYEPAFAAAQDGLNANWGRLETAVIHFKETVYESSGGVLNSMTKMATEGVKHLTALYDGTEKLSEAMKIVLGAAAAAVALEFGAMVVKLLEASAAMKALRLAWIAQPEIAIVVAAAGAFAALTNSARESSAAIRDTMESVRQAKAASIGDLSSKAKTEAELISINAELDDTVTNAKKDLKSHEDRLNSLMKDTDATWVSGQRIYTAQEAIKIEKKAIEKSTETIKKAREEAVAKLNKQAEDLAKEQTSTRVAAYDAAIKDAHTRELKKLDTLDADLELAREQIREKNSKMLEDAKADIEAFKNLPKDVTPFVREQAGIKARKAEEAVLANTKELAAAEAEVRERHAKKNESTANKAHAAKMKAIKTDIAIDNDYIQTLETQKDIQLRLLDSGNKAKIVSFQKYFDQRKAIYDKAYEDEKGFYQKQLDLARGSGDKKLVTRAEQDLVRLQLQYEGDVENLQNTRISKEADYETNLNAIKQRYDDILGIQRDTDEVSSNTLRVLKEQIQAQIEAGGADREHGLAAKDMLETYLKVEAVNKQFTEHQKAVARGEKVYHSAIEKTKTLKDAGVVSELQAAIANTKANEKLIKLKEAQIKADEKSLEMGDLQGMSREGFIDRINAQKEALENFKVTADEVATLFEGKLSSAFESSFTGLIMGTKSAKEAFTDFGKSVVGTIAEMVAAEMRSQILKPLLSAAFSAISGGLGSLFGGAGSAISGLMSASEMTGGMHMTGSLANLHFAKGGVMSGAGISAYSGQVVDKPTIFPFAKGVGLMGEAGAEAILPLKRNSQGKLGVSLENAGQAANNNVYYINTTVNAGSNSKPDDIGNKVAEQVMRAIAKQEISSAARRGNQLNPITRYG